DRAAGEGARARRHGRQHDGHQPLDGAFLSRRAAVRHRRSRWTDLSRTRSRPRRLLSQRHDPLSARGLGLKLLICPEWVDNFLIRTIVEESKYKAGMVGSFRKARRAGF